MNGRIFKIESMGMHDGPGIRTVVFLSGCKLRCKYCHNPESWTNSGEEISSEELLKKIIKFKPYYERSGGGVTFSGGEPLLQAEFLKEMLKFCKNEGIHTCIDTAGVGNCTIDEYNEILSYADLVLFDVKATENNAYNEICGSDISHSEKFIKALEIHAFLCYFAIEQKLLLQWSI
jgi:pyruvate formate lyase activating enzyme